MNNEFDLDPGVDEGKSCDGVLNNEFDLDPGVDEGMSWEGALHNEFDLDPGVDEGMSWEGALNSEFDLDPSTPSCDCCAVKSEFDLEPGAEAVAGFSACCKEFDLDPGADMECVWYRELDRATKAARGGFLKERRGEGVLEFSSSSRGFTIAL